MNNPALTSLGNLSALISVGITLNIVGNSALSSCNSLRPLLDDVDDGKPGPGPGIAGIPDVADDVILENNLPGCNSVNEILSQIPSNRAVTVALSDASAGDIAKQGGNTVCGLDLPHAGNSSPNDFDPDAYSITISAFPTIPNTFNTISFATLVPYDITDWTYAGGIPGSNADNELYTYDNPPFGAAAVATITWSSATQLISNTTTVQSCAGCAWNLLLFANATSNFTVDVLGYYSGGAFTPVPGCRVMDTRKWEPAPTTTTTMTTTTTTTTTTVP